MMICPCGSQKPLPLCCQPYLKGRAAPTAEALMRSRYTAYALGNLDYIERTAAGPAAKAFDRQEAIISNSATEWLGLTITARSAGLQSDERGTVSFTFECRQNGRIHTQSEVSDFRKIDGRWFYWDRQKSSDAHNVGRNDPCPCGSGKKFKKCCGAN